MTERAKVERLMVKFLPCLIYPGMWIVPFIAMIGEPIIQDTTQRYWSWGHVFCAAAVTIPGVVISYLIGRCSIEKEKNERT